VIEFLVGPAFISTKAISIALCHKLIFARIPWMLQ
jgi:hypothetical protein